MLDRTASMADRLSMRSRNAFKVGLFGANCSSGRSATTVPERWPMTWPECLRLAQMADEAGIDFMLPIGRWKGYGGETDFHGTTFETVTWATGLLAATRRITVFGTVHAPLFHPIIAAKEFVTADHVGEGRFGLNIVAGWNEGEFEMFGVQQRDHEGRYEYAQEWIDVVRRAWAEPDTFDINGTYFKLAGVRAFPKPFGGTRPIIMNAGCRSGRRLRYETAMHSSPPRPTSRKYRRSRSRRANFGREISVFTVGQVVCRPSQREADDYYHHAVIENADWGAVDGMLALKNITRQTGSAEEFQNKRDYFAANAIGGYPFVGTPDRVAEELATICQAGMSGIAVSFINYLIEAPYFCDKVLPRLVRLGVCVKH